MSSAVRYSGSKDPTWKRQRFCRFHGFGVYKVWLQTLVQTVTNASIPSGLRFVERAFRITEAEKVDLDA